MNKKPLMALAAVGMMVLFTAGCDRDEPAPECNNRVGSVNCALPSDEPSIAVPSPSSSYWQTPPLDRPGSITDQTHGLVYDEDGNCLRFCGTTPDRTPAV
jgi:hypothetical protein